MTVSASFVTRLRRMVDEPTDATYDDTALEEYLTRYRIMDTLGSEPYTWTSTTPPTQVDNTSWIETYDVHAAAAEIWTEKAAAVYDQHDFSADGGSYKVSQLYDHCVAMATFHNARASIKSIKLIKSPAETLSSDTIGNLAEPKDGPGFDTYYLDY